ncbi:hypothetical protein P4B35_19945 [Pontiellaceae bacterium B12227]|nr:hypothetical protein [Pontiellaceae bacterium B12227]
MMSDKTRLETPAEDQAEVLLKQLMHLKQYERPDAARMTRNKQNIMRSVRQAQSEKRKPLLDLLAINIPWFFAEPKYGIAALFVAFVGLQYVGINARNSATSTGIYTSTASVASYERDAALSVVSNRYPNLPSNSMLFSQPQGDQTVMPANFELKR